MANKLTNEEIYFKAVDRINKKGNYSLEEIIVELEKEIDYYRNKIRSIEETYSDDGLVWFKVNQKVDSEQLHKFLLSYVPMGEVLNLYKLLKNDMEV